jgi:diamine N-acetyltransferase
VSVHAARGRREGERTQVTQESGQSPASERDAPVVTIRPITSDNWRAALDLSVSPEQLPFVSGSPAPVALALAKAYIRPGGTAVTPFGIYAAEQIVGFFALMQEPGRADRCWINHLLIDSRYQRRGYGSAALRAIVGLLREQYPRCASINLTVSPCNHAAAHLYRRFGFVATGELAWGEPWYRLPLPWRE